MAIYQAVVIGASSGGLAAISSILESLPGNFSLPVIIVQHLHPSQKDDFILPMRSRCPLSLKIADEKEMILPGYVYFAPPNYHLLVEKDRTFSLSVDARVRFARPSIDVLFESAADVYASELVGIILTGANDDGAAGLLAVKRNNGLTIVQDPSDAEVKFMPCSALEMVDVDRVLTAKEIGPYLCVLDNSRKL